MTSYVKSLLIAFALAMLSITPRPMLSWWNFNRQRRREDFGITLSPRFFSADGALRGLAGASPNLYQKLVEEHAELKRQGQAILDEAAASEAGVLTDEHREKLATIHARLDQLEGKDGKPGDIAIANMDARRNIAGAPAAVDDPTKLAKNGDTGPDADPDKLPTPFKSFGEQLVAVAAAATAPHSTDRRLIDIQAAAAGASEGVASDGGFLVQTDYTSELLELAHDASVLYGRTDSRPISPTSNGIKINAVDETSRADGSRQGGILAYWTGEAGALTGTKPKFRQMELSFQKLTGLYYATDEELADVPALAGNISRWFSDEFGFKLDDAIVRGTGAGMPLGVLGHAGTVSVSKEAGQAAATILLENIQKMYARVRPRSLTRGQWYINQDCWPQLFQLSQVVGLGGVPVFLPPGGASAAPFGTLMGRPVTPIEQCETLGTVGDIMFADLNEYITIEKGGVQAATSIHVQFLTDETAFRFILRVDGQPKRNAPLTPYKGSNTLSPFVTLNTRA